MCEVPEDIENELHNRSHEFFKLDYEQSLEIIRQLHDQKLSYQKFYVSLAVSIVTLSILIFRFTPTGTAKGISTDNLVGVLFVLSGMIGYIVIRNLTSIRCNEVFFNNLVIDLRRIYIKGLNIGNYANLKFAISDDRGSADYISILGCSAINFFMLLIGLLLIFSNGNPIQLSFSVGVVSFMYLLLHIFTIEKALSSGVRPETDPSSCANN